MVISNGNHFLSHSLFFFFFGQQIDREFHVQQALHKANFPVPKPLFYCQDNSIIGTAFYVMEHVEVSQQTMRSPN